MLLPFSLIHTDKINPTEMVEVRTNDLRSSCANTINISISTFYESHWDGCVGSMQSAYFTCGYHSLRYTMRMLVPRRSSSCEQMVSTPHVLLPSHLNYWDINDSTEIVKIRVRHLRLLNSTSSHAGVRRRYHTAEIDDLKRCDLRSIYGSIISFRIYRKDQSHRDHYNVSQASQYSPC